MSDLPAMLRRVDRVDGLRMFRRMIPRRWKRYVGVAALVVMLARPDVASQAAQWIWEDRAQRMVAIMTGTQLPE